MITLTVAKIDDSSQTVEQTTLSNINKYLAAAANVINSQIASKDFDLKVTLSVRDLPGSFASAGSYMGTIPGSKKFISQVQSKMVNGVSLNSSDQVSNKSDILINLSPDIVAQINANLTQAVNVNPNDYAFKLVLHELGHALGFSSARNSSTGQQYSSDTATTFDSQVDIIAGSPFFLGKSAMALYGGKVPLYKLGTAGTSISHFTLESVNGIASKFSPSELLLADNEVWGAESVVYSDMDLAVFRDLGYKIKNTITSFDKHTFIPGVETTKVVGDIAAPDTVVLDGPRNNATIKKIANSDVLVNTKSVSNIGLAAIDTIQFDDYTVNLNIGRDSKLIEAGQLDKLVQLYIAFFNRVPDAAGLDYWINRAHDGMSMNGIADSFFINAQALSAVTGYSPNATNRELVLNVYKNVLNRTSSTVPPDEAGVSYWVNDLDSGAQTKSSLINAMIVAGYADVTTAKVLDNKLYVGKYFAVDQGLGFSAYDTSAEAKSVAITAAVTANDYSSALKLIGVTENDFANQFA